MKSIVTQNPLYPNIDREHPPAFAGADPRFGSINCCKSIPEGRMPCAAFSDTDFYLPLKQQLSVFAKHCPLPPASS
jgi:hypothetical protein